MKMPENEILKINFMTKKQRSVKGLKLGDRQNTIDHLVRTGVECSPKTIDDDVQDSRNADEVIGIEVNDDNNVDAD